MISSPHNEKIKLALALQSQAKARRKSGRVLLEGVRLIADALACGLRPDFVLHHPDFAPETFAPELPMFAIAPELLREIADTVHPQGAVAVFPLPQMPLPTAPTRLFILDGVRDPGNVGAMLRTAAAAGVDAALLSPDCADAFNPKALRAGMGAHFRVPLREIGWEQIAALCAGLTVYLADADGDLAYDAGNWRQPHALIVSSEAHGASAEARSLAALRISIPMAAATESLNAASAAAVLLFEAARARRS
jgi:TrmH family RNA methyltransferase